VRERVRKGERYYVYRHIPPRINEEEEPFALYLSVTFAAVYLSRSRARCFDFPPPPPLTGK